MKNNNEKVIALYRVSTKTQDYARQETELGRMMAIDGWSEEQIIPVGKKESGVLLSMNEREGIKEMKHHIENENVVAVYVHELSRLSRRVADTFMLRDYLLARHVQLICLNPNIKCFTEDWKIDPTANMIFGVMAAMAENEGYLRKERLAGGKAERKAKGLFAGGNPSYGYHMPNKKEKLQILEEKAAVVRRIFDLYVNQQLSCLSIARLLTNDGTITGKHSSEVAAEKFVRGILHNSDYIGNEIYPQIISSDLYIAANERMESQYVKPRQSYKNNVYFGQGLLYADGLPLTVRKDQVRYCSSRHKDGRRKAEAVGINLNLVDSLLMFFYTTLDHEGETKTNIDKCKGKIADLQKVIATKEKTVADLTESLYKIEERLVKGRINDAQADRLREGIESDMKGAKKVIANAEDEIMKVKDAMEKLKNDKADIYALTDAQVREEILKSVKRVEVCKIARNDYQLEIVPTAPFEFILNVTVNPFTHQVWQIVPTVDDSNPKTTYHKHPLNVPYIERFKNVLCK